MPFPQLADSDPSGLNMRIRASAMVDGRARSKPSDPIPKCRSHISLASRAHRASSTKEPDSSTVCGLSTSSRTKSFPAPCIFTNCNASPSTAHSPAVRRSGSQINPGAPAGDGTRRIMPERSVGRRAAWREAGWLAKRADDAVCEGWIRGVEPLDAALSAEPRLLSSNERVGRVEDSVARLAELRALEHDLRKIGVARRGHRRQRRLEAHGEERSDLIEPAVLEHTVEALCEDLVKAPTVATEPDPAGRDRDAALSARPRERDPRRDGDFERSDDSASVPRVDRPSRQRIEDGEPPVEAAGSVARIRALEPATKHRAPRTGLEAIDERLDVMWAPPDDQRDATSSRDVRQRPLAEVLVRRNAERLVRVDDVDQVVGRGGALGRCWLRGAHVHVVVDLPRVRGDHLSADAASDLDRERSLPDPGCPRDDDDLGVEPRRQDAVHHPVVRRKMVTRSATEIADGPQFFDARSRGGMLVGVFGCVNCDSTPRPWLSVRRNDGAPGPVDDASCRSAVTRDAGKRLLYSGHSFGSDASEWTTSETRPKPERSRTSPLPSPLTSAGPSFVWPPSRPSVKSWSVRRARPRRRQSRTNSFTTWPTWSRSSDPKPESIAWSVSASLPPVRSIRSPAWSFARRISRGGPTCRWRRDSRSEPVSPYISAMMRTSPDWPRLGLARGRGRRTSCI